nr:phosphatase PAP2 family protein [uncultured Bacteroides sp.]
MILADVLSRLVEMDTDLLLAINGWRAEWADYFMYAFSGRWIWVPMYAAIFYVILRNFNWRIALGCVIAVALTITFADQVCATVIRPLVCRLRPTNPENPLSEFVQIVNDYRGGRYGFPSCHAANTFGLAFFIFYLFRNRALNWFIMLWAIVTCYSRSYLGVHFPGDLLVGAIVGFIGATLCYWLFGLLCKYKCQKDYKHLYAPIIVGGVTIIGILIYALVRVIL